MNRCACMQEAHAVLSGERPYRSVYFRRNPMGKTTTYKVGRKAGPGTFCTVAWARSHPQIAVVETIKRTSGRKTTK